MGDEEAEVKLYAYTGDRATGEIVEVTAGEEPKVLTKSVELCAQALPTRCAAAATATPLLD